MREVADGQPPKQLKFREGDFWHDLATDYNAMIARLAPESNDKSAVEQEKPVAVAD